MVMAGVSASPYLLFALLAVSSAVCFASAILAPVDERAVAGEDERRNHTGNICDDEDDGQQCHDNGVAMCHREYTRSYTKCAFYEECVGLKPSGAVCREDACAYKADGWHCHEGHVVECRMSVTVNVTSCAFYEDCEKDPLVPNAASCRGYVCEHKPNGTHCKDDHVLTCEGGLAWGCGRGVASGGIHRRASVCAEPGVGPLLRHAISSNRFPRHRERPRSPKAETCGRLVQTISSIGSPPPALGP